MSLKIYDRSILAEGNGVIPCRSSMRIDLIDGYADGMPSDLGKTEVGLGNI